MFPMPALGDGVHATYDHSKSWSPPRLRPTTIRVLTKEAVQASTFVVDRRPNTENSWCADPASTPGRLEDRNK